MKDVVLPPGTSPDLSGGVREPAGFTPGPWTAIGDHVRVKVEIPGVGLVNCTIAIAVGTGRGNFDGLTPYVVPGTEEDNARLIAAAPDLLEALQNLTAIMGQAWPALMGTGPLLGARAAIAKALGASTASPAERQGTDPGMNPNPLSESQPQ